MQFRNASYFCQIDIQSLFVLFVAFTSAILGGPVKGVFFFFPLWKQPVSSCKSHESSHCAGLFVWISVYCFSVTAFFYCYYFFVDEEFPACKCGWLTGKTADSEINELTDVCYWVNVFIAKLPSLDWSWVAWGDVPTGTWLSQTSLAVLKAPSLILAIPKASHLR